MPGATDVVLHIGTNDIAAGRDAPEIVDGLVRFAGLARAAGQARLPHHDHAVGRRAARHAAGRAVRDEVNRWVREQGPEHADGVFDFAAAVADPARPGRLLDRYDAGDGLHLSEAGYRALAGRRRRHPAHREPVPGRTAARRASRSSDGRAGG